MAESAEAADILKNAIAQMVQDGLPKDELPLLLSQFAYMFAQVLDKDRGPVALLTYMSKMAVNNEDNPPGPIDDNPIEGRHQNDLAMKSMIESLEAESGAPITYDMSLLGHAMESLTTLQDMPVEQASTGMLCYALNFLVRQRGIESGEQLVKYAQSELARIQAE